MMQKILFVLIISFCFLTSADAQRTDPGLIWREHSCTTPFCSDQWIGDSVSIGNYGTQVELGTSVGNPNPIRVFSSSDANPPQALLQLPSIAETWKVRTASASTTDLQAALQARVRTGVSYEKELVLRVSSLSNQQRNWSYVFPTTTSDGNILNNFVKIDRTGNKIVTVTMDSSGTKYLKVFSPDSNIPVASLTISSSNIVMPIDAVELSADGSTLALLASMAVRVYSLPSMSLLYSSTPSSSTFHGLALSGDGSTLAIGKIGRFDVFTRNAANQYGYAYSHFLAGSNYCDRLDISDDGTTIVAGFNFYDSYLNVTVESVDLVSQTLLMTKTFTVTGADARSNLISGVSISADGSTFAVGIWGTLATSPNVIPQLYFFRRDSDIPLNQYILAGSVTDLEISADGKRCIVGTKDEHASSFAQASGSLELYQVLPQDIAVHGVPHASGQIQIELKGTPGRNATVLMSHSLATNPQTFPQMGTLHLNRADISVISAGTFDAQGRATATITLPAAVGTELFFQKLETGNLQPRRLGEDFVKVQVIN